MSAHTIVGLPSTICSRVIPVNDLDIHILEALPPVTNDGKLPLLLLLHGFPEISYSWRKVMAPLAARGFAVVAPDQRGFGQTAKRGEPLRKAVYTDDLAPYRILNMVNDVVSLVYALGYTAVAAVVGHDFGARIAGHCALIRPDLFASVVFISSPFTGAPSPSTMQHVPSETRFAAVDGMLAELDPPRRHYTMYYSGPQAAADMLDPPGGLHGFLRAYFHVKSADWEGNVVTPSKEISPGVFAAMPHYYIMPRNSTMPSCVAPHSPSPEQVARNTWLTDAELSVYVAQYTATGFQGALNAYRCQTDAQWSADLYVFAGEKVEVPAMFIGGRRDWGPFQMPGAAETMKTEVCRKMREEDFVLVEGAGHWVQQERPDAVVDNILRFLNHVVVS